MRRARALFLLNSFVFYGGVLFFLCKNSVPFSQFAEENE